MIIKSITLENFRSYYGVNTIEVGDRLTLMIGANGEGKTTLFEALEWLFDTTDLMPKVDTKYVSKKKISDLESTESANVKVSMTYVCNGSERIYEKSFKFTKTLSGEISPSNFAVRLYIQNGVEKDVRDGNAALAQFDRDFPSSVRQYCLFKGEQELNIFNKPAALAYLVETFSQVRNFDPYLHFMDRAKSLSEKATDNAMSSDRKNTREATRLRGLIKSEEEKLGDLKSELKVKQTEAANFQSLLENLEQNKEASSLLHSTNERLATLKEQLKQAQGEIKEEYNFRLLDEMWILMGFLPIAEEFRQLVAKLEKSKRAQQSKYDQEIGAKKLAKTIQQELVDGHVPLAINVPDENTMREMLNDEICKVCGRPAHKGTPEYAFMQARLDAFLASKKTVEDEEEVEPLFKNDYIGELNRMYNSLHNNMRFLTNLDGFITKAIIFNFEKHSQIDKITANIDREEDSKKKILAQTEGLTEDQLVSAYYEISEWWSGRMQAERSSEYLSTQIEKHEKDLAGYRQEYSKISEESSAAMYARSSQAILKILNAFTAAKQSNKREFLNQLEEAANEYLAQLNKGDFRGTARIVEKPDDSAEIILVDVDGTRVYNPNTALKTTMYMSLLFAVAKLTTIKHENDYPLIFDAPTSSFTGSKEGDFFSVIGDIQKQTIIVTKSFLTEKENSLGESLLDKSKIEKINAKKYRLKLKRPFVEEDLSTIQTVIEDI